MDNQSLAHSRYNCTYHIVFIPKYRRKVMFGKLRKDVGEILGKERRFRKCNVSGIFFCGNNMLILNFVEYPTLRFHNYRFLYQTST